MSEFDLAMGQIQLFLTDTYPLLHLAKISVSKWYIVVERSSF
jgi:hypothetical protein